MSSMMPIRGIGRPLVAADWTVADEWKILEIKIHSEPCPSNFFESTTFSVQLPKLRFVYLL